MHNPTINWEGDTRNLPKISIVTPCFNHASYIEATILSVLSQGYPNLEYIVLDGGSTDGSAEIIKKYSDYLSYWHSKPDAGQYQAIQAGFDRSTGEIMAWLNSDDMLQRNSLWTVAEIFTKMPQVEWLLGNPTWYDSMGRTVVAGQPPRWSRYRYLRGDYKWIQQESVFWIRSLWNAAGCSLDTSYAYAADFELWMRFFRHAKLYSTTAILSGFRSASSGQKGRKYRALYVEEVEEIISSEPLTVNDMKILKGIAKIESWRNIPIVRIFSGRIRRIRRIYESHLGLPPVIKFNLTTNAFEFDY